MDLTSSRSSALQSISTTRESAPPDPERAAIMGRLVAGFGLLLVGGGLAIWIVRMIHRVLFTDTVPALVTKLTPTDPHDLTLTFGDYAGMLPKQLFPVTGYILTFLLLWVCAWMAMVFVKGGIVLLQNRRNRRVDEDA